MTILFFMNFVLTLLMLKELHSPCANFVVGFSDLLLLLLLLLYLFFPFVFLAGNRQGCQIW
uniref:G-protein coupled receptors family 1 profile domain-containing protein n=1 Tax=Anguilla anguilla TaxID=7936 RepID=A0A0E9RNS4_ANGAN